MKKKIVSIILVLTMILSLAACGSKEKKEDTKETGESSGKSKKIAYCINSSTDTFEVYVYEGAKKYCEEKGIELVLVDGEDDTATQLSKMDSICESGVDGVILVPVDTNGDGSEYRKIADEYEVPLVSAVRQCQSAWVMVSTDSSEAGKMQGEYIVENYGEKLDVALLVGILGSEDMTKRTESLKGVLSKYPDINIVFEDCANWNRDEGMAIAENWIQSKKNIDVVVANNDEMAIGAGLALEASDMLEDVAVIGIDAQENGLAAMEDGILTASVFQPAGEQGKTAVETVLDCIDGKYTGEKTEWVQINFEMVTQDNFKEYMQ